MRRGRVIGFGAALLAGAVIGIILWPRVERAWMLRALFSEDGAERAGAAAWWSDAPDGGASRLAAHPGAPARIIAGLEVTEDEQTFVDVATMLRDAGLWRLPAISTSLWRRRLELILDSDDLEAALSVLDEIAVANVARDDPNAIALWRRLIEWPHHAAVRKRALLDAARRCERGAFETMAAAARDDDDGQVRRFAALLSGFLRRAAGTEADWRGKEPRVAEAILWAATASEPRDASPLLAACDESPWPTTTLPWLLSRSDDPAARRRLETLAVDGNPAASLHLAERWGAGVDQLPEKQRTWLGGEVKGAEKQALERWSAWRRGEGDAERLLESPVAEDGSVWAAVLLAERIVNSTSLPRQSHRWFSEVDPAAARAGVLLNGLTIRDGWMLSEEYVRTEDPALRRALRLAMAMASVGAGDTAATDRAYAWTVVTTIPEQSAEALLALLAIGDERAVASILSVPEDSPAGAALLERAWLIERFLPDYAALVGRLCPWDDAVAALQFDIMATAWALHGGAATFDPDSRKFRYTARAAPAR